MFAPASPDRPIAALLEALTALRLRAADLGGDSFQRLMLARPAPPPVEPAVPQPAPGPDRELATRREPTGEDSQHAQQSFATPAAETATAADPEAQASGPADSESDFADNMPPQTAAGGQPPHDAAADGLPEPQQEAIEPGALSPHDGEVQLAQHSPASQQMLPQPHLPESATADAGQTNDVPPTTDESPSALAAVDGQALPADGTPHVPQRVEPLPPDQLGDQLHAVVQQLESLRASLDGVLPPPFVEQLDALLQQARQLAGQLARAGQAAEAAVEAARQLLADLAERLPPPLRGTRGLVQLPLPMPQPEVPVRGASNLGNRGGPHSGSVPASGAQPPWDAPRGEHSRLPAMLLPGAADAVQPLPLPLPGVLPSDMAGFGTSPPASLLVPADAAAAELSGATPPPEGASPRPAVFQNTVDSGEREPIPLKLQRLGPTEQRPAGFHSGRFVHRVAHAVQAAFDRGGPIRLRLSPPELGAVRLVVSLRDGTLSARLEAETAAARNVLLDHLPLLRDRLAQQQIKIERFEVDLLHQPAADQRHHGSDAHRQQHFWSSVASMAPKAPPGTPPATDEGLSRWRAASPGGVDVVV
jgi:flagellar hook-length control protein FliK